MKISCPSGFEFTARKWTIGDQVALLDTKEDAGASLPSRMVSLAATGVVKPGPYVFPGNVIDWSLVSIADIAVANVLIRAETKEELLLHPLCKNCRQLQLDPKAVDLLDLPIFDASVEGIEHLRTDVPVPRNINGVQVLIKAVRSRDMAVLAALQNQDETRMLEIQTASAIAEIRVPGQQSPIRMLPDIRAFLQTQSWDFRTAIEEETDTLFGGIDMDLTFKCDHLGCGAEQVQAIPLDPTFYGLDPNERRHRHVKASLGRSARERMQKASTPSSSGSPKPQDTASVSPK